MKRILTILLAFSLASTSFNAASQAMFKLPENIVCSQVKPYNPQGDSRLEGQSYNFAATILVYPDTRLDEAAARTLMEEIDFSEARSYANASVYVVNPLGAKYEADADYDAFVNVYNTLRSGNLKLVGIGNGATFINSVLAPRAAGYISGILSIGGKPAKLPKGTPHDGVPAYIAGVNATRAAASYISLNDAQKCGENLYCNEYEPLFKVMVNADTKATIKELFADAWSRLLSKSYRFNNFGHTHYEGCKLGEYGINEIEPYINLADLKIVRKAVEQPQGKDAKWLWYEYWPEELMEGAPEHSVPVMVLLHGNTNDPRTQAETSGFIQLAGEERFFVVEMEWQGSAYYAAMGHDGVESTILNLLAKYPQLDPSRVYAEGLSAGSMTASALGIKKSHIFAAVGGHSGGLMGGRNYGYGVNSLEIEATQKRGAVEMPYCSVLGTADKVVPFITPDNYKGNGYLNAWNIYQTMNGMPVVRELDFSIDPIFGQKLEDRQSLEYKKGSGITVECGQMYKDGKPLIKIVAVMNYGHWNFQPAARIMWDYFKQFSRDPEPRKLVYTLSKE